MLHLLILSLDDLSFKTLWISNVDSLNVREKLLLSTLLVVSLSGDTDTDSVWDTLDTSGPKLLVQLRVDTDIRGTHLQLGELLDLSDSTWGSLLELDTEHLKNNRLA
jgi:hypothetical protein